MKFSFHPEAEEEFEASIAYYEQCDPGLGLDFAREVHTAIQNALTYPSLWTEIEPDVRRCLTHRFPFGVLYSIEQDDIFILAVMHLHREPGYWKHRLSGTIIKDRDVQMAHRALAAHCRGHSMNNGHLHTPPTPTTPKPSPWTRPRS